MLDDNEDERGENETLANISLYAIITLQSHKLNEYQQDMLRQHPHHTSDTVPIYQLMYHLTLEITHRVTLGRVETSHALKEQLHWARRL